MSSKGAVLFAYTHTQICIRTRTATVRTAALVLSSVHRAADSFVFRRKVWKQITNVRLPSFSMETNHKGTFAFFSPGLANKAK